MRFLAVLLLCFLVIPVNLSLAQEAAQSPLRVRVGEHPGFNRIVFDWPARVRYSVDSGPGYATVTFDQAATLDLSRYSPSRVPLIEGVTSQQKNGSLVVRLQLPQGASVSDFYNLNSVVVDVSAVAPAKPARTAQRAAVPQSAGLPAATTAAPRLASQQAQASDSTSPKLGLEDKKKGKGKKGGKDKDGKNGVEFDIDDSPSTRYEILPSLTVGGTIELESDYEGNFDLDDTVDDDHWTAEPALEVALDYAPVDYFEFFTALRFAGDFELLDEDGKKNNTEELVFEELNVTFRDFVPGLSTRIGRQRVKDEREWLYDEELDGVNLYYRYQNFGLEASVNQQGLVDLDLLGDDDDEDIVNYFVFGHYKPNKDHQLGTFLVVRDDTRKGEPTPIFVGGRAIGEVVDDLDYWLQAAFATGHTLNPVTGERDRLSGFGIDTGATYVVDTTLKPSFTLAFAFGSGDSDPTDGTDHSFRQTGLQDNQDRFNGVARFRYYGEVLDPELSNLFIYTAGAGIKPSKKSSLDLVYHYYSLDEAQFGSANSSKDLGQEVDLVLGMNEIKGVKFELTLGYFFPGDVFPDGADPAWLVSSEFRVRF